MRRTRFMSLVFVALSLALLGVQDFRWALETPLWEYRFNRWTSALVASWSGKGAPEPEAPAMLSAAQMQTLNEQKAGDARATALLALYLPREQRGTKFDLAWRAVDADRSLGWVLASVGAQYPGAARDPQLNLRIEGFISRLEQIDADNASPHLMRAQYIRQRMTGVPNPINFKDDAQQELLARQSEWVAAMDRAFRAPRYNSYGMERFLFLRSALTDRGWATPWCLLVEQSTPIMNLLSSREYANLQVYLGKKEEKAGKVEDAIRRYYVVSNYGQRMATSGNSIIEALVGSSVEKIVGPALADALDKAGRHEEATGVRVRQKADLAKVLGDPLTKTTNREWAVVLMHGFVSGVVVFGVLALVALLYLTAKLVVRPDERGRLYDFMAVLENYSAVLLAICCFGLYVTYFPYAQNFRSYMAATGDMRQLSYLVRNSLPVNDVLVTGSAAELPNPLVGYAIWGILALILATALAALDARRDQAAGAARMAISGRNK